MAFSRAVQLMSVTLIAAALWSSTTAVVIIDDYVAPQPPRNDFPQERHHGTWAACEPAVCHQVQTQSEGLDKIKTLKNFVRETLSLLDALVTSLDKELVEAGSSLRQFVGPRCPTSHSILDRVAKSDEEADRFNFNARDGEVHGDLEVAITGSGDQELSQEQVQPSQEEEQRHHQDHKDYQQQREYDQKQKKYQHSVEHGSGKSTLRHSESTSSGSSSSSSSSSSQYHQSSHSASSNGGKSASSHKTHSSTRHGSSSGQTSVGGTGGDTFSKSSRVEAQIGKQSVCRGVMKGESPYWVPGLDDWCEQNCSQGYCPQTHCVCGTH